ncbi:hypothetical protein BC828DRAFT_387713 [Blastocladiella britannica]|nr:hypothetical protein BC828DRAFT_387713 [Blastocladiella britannica]
MIVAFTLLNAFFSGPTMPDVSFTRTRFYGKAVTTPKHHVQAYVNGDQWATFERSYPRNVPEFMHEVEQKFITRLAESCRRERSIRDTAVQRAVGWGIGKPDPDALKKARNSPMPSCHQLSEMGYRIQ